MAEKGSLTVEESHAIYEKVKADFRKTLDDLGVTDELLAKKLLEELNATEPKTFQYKGDVIESKEKIAWEVCQRARVDAHHHTFEPTTRSRKSLEQPTTQAAKSKWDMKKRAKKFTEALLCGQSEKQALITAGYSYNTASHPSEVAILRNPAYLKPFISILEKKGVTDEFLAEKTKTLLEAKKPIFFQKDGVVTDERIVEALETQRKTLEMVNRVKGHLKDRSEVDVNVGIMAMVVQAVKGENGENGEI